MEHKSMPKNTDLFYQVEIIKRNKDIVKGDPISAIKNKELYRNCIADVKDLEEKMPVIQEICNKLKARAYFYYNRRSYIDLALFSARRILETFPDSSGAAKNAWQSMFSLHPHEDKSDLLWMSDLDGLCDLTVKGIISDIRKISSDPEDPVYPMVIPTPGGCHLICKSFRKDMATGDLETLIKDGNSYKNRATVLYCPDFGINNEFEIKSDVASALV